MPEKPCWVPLPKKHPSTSLLRQGCEPGGFFPFFPQCSLKRARRRCCLQPRVCASWHPASCSLQMPCALAARPVWAAGYYPWQGHKPLQFLEFGLSRRVLIKQRFPSAPKASPLPVPCGSRTTAGSPLRQSKAQHIGEKKKLFPQMQSSAVHGTGRAFIMQGSVFCETINH